MKTVLFVPGFRAPQDSKKFSSVITAIESKGYRVRFVSIQWQRTNVYDWVKQLNEVYAHYDPAQTILAGFSFGSTTAFMSAIERKPSELWLFSLSPYFSEDMPHMKKSWLTNIGSRRAEIFRQLHFEDLAKQIKCKTLLIAGEVESKKYPLIGNRSRTAHKAIKNSRLVWVPETNHEIIDPRYIAAIKRNI